jgi:aryl-alcohol dehydrogenase-like predicted oxidoreductase
VDAAASPVIGAYYPGYRAASFPVERIGAIAQARDATRAQVALAWLLSRKSWIVPIPGTTKLHRLDENLGAANIALSAQELAEIERALAGIEIVGARYPQQLQQNVGR